VAFPVTLASRGTLFTRILVSTGCQTSPATLLLRVISQLSVDQYCSAWAHFKALFVLYTFDLCELMSNSPQSTQRSKRRTYPKQLAPNLGLLQQK
jgi:hypothetical protein